MRTRQMRVGWLGIGVILFFSTAASAGPSFIRFDESDPVASTPIQKTSTSFLARATRDGQPFDSQPLEQLDQMSAVWHALPETPFSSIPDDSVAAAAVAQPLSVPLQFGWLGVLAFTTVGSYLGARWVGIRRNHSR
jgi:hypothetical protein